MNFAQHLYFHPNEIINVHSSLFFYVLQDLIKLGNVQMQCLYNRYKVIISN